MVVVAAAVVTLEGVTGRAQEGMGVGEALPVSSPMCGDLLRPRGWPTHSQAI